MRCFLSARCGSPEERKKAARRANVWAIPLPELKQSQVYQKLFLDLLKEQWGVRCSDLFHLICIHCKKKVSEFSVPSRLSLIKHSLAGIIKLFPSRESLVSDIPAAGDSKPFFNCV
jgi:hypothetical protein